MYALKIKTRVGNSDLVNKGFDDLTKNKVN